MKPLSLPTPHLIILVGIPGAGRTQFGEHFTTTFNAKLVSIDAIHKEIFGAKANDTSLALAGRVANYLLDEFLTTGLTVVFDGATETKTARIELAKKAVKHGYVPIVVWVQTDPSEARRRAARKDATKPLTDAEYDAALNRFQTPSKVENPVVLSGKHTHNTQLRALLNRLASAHTLATRRMHTPDRPDGSRNIKVQ